MVVATDAVGPIHILVPQGHSSSWLKSKYLAASRNDFPLSFTSEVELKMNVNPPNYAPVICIYSRLFRKWLIFQ